MSLTEKYVSHRVLLEENSNPWLIPRHDKRRGVWQQREQQRERRLKE